MQSELRSPVGVAREESSVCLLSEVFFPLGFPVQVSTNRVEALEIARKSWSQFQRMSTREPLVIELEFVSSEERQEAVEAPCTSVEGELLTVAFDKHGAVVADLEQGHARGTLDEAVLAAELNLRYYVLEAIALSMISTLRAVALHAACVAWKKAGVLICGESGAGKTTLAYACARSGWKYISDDASYLLLEGQGRRVIGNCHQIRFRDTAAVLFTELSGRGTTSRVAGKPSIEVCTSELHGVQQADYAVIQFIIFLNRRSESIPGLYPIERWRGQEYFARFLLVPAHQYSRAKQALEGLLGAQMFELRYTDLDWAVRFLSRAIEEGDICTTG